VARIATSVVALPGQMVFAGDKLGELTDERMRLLQQALPVCDVRPLDLFPIFELKPIWDLKIHRPFADWDVVALFNWSDDDATVGFRFVDLGLPDDHAYLAFDFWAEEFPGACSGGFSATLAPRSSMLLALHRDRGRPQFLPTDRHVTQGGVSLKELTWDADAQRLAGTSELVAGHRSVLFFHVPDGYALESAEGEGVDVCRREMRDGNVLALALEHSTSGPIDWVLHFGKADGVQAAVAADSSARP